MDLTGTSVAGYRITAKLGEGGMGVVWRATDTRLDREVAIKLLPQAVQADPERLARFEREAKLLAQLNHPNIAQIYGLETSGEQRALVMELVEGPTLAERLESGAFPLAESCSVALQIAQALEEAHEKGIVHRDLKPQNVKASREGKVKVLDFGLAKAMDPTASASGGAATLANSPTLTAVHGTQMGVILGTASYMAPEQAAGGAADRRADIWSFGVVLYEMLAGRRLFEGETVSHVLAGVLKDEPDFSALPAEVPPRVRRLVRRCLRKRPRERLQSIGDARVILEEVLAGAPDEVVGTPAASTAPRGRPAWQAALALGAAVALGALGTLAIGGRSAPATPAPRALAEIALPAGQRPPFFGPDLALSPDGSRLALVLRDEATQRRAIWIRTIATGDLRAVPGTDEASLPFWSPDGRSIGYRSGPENQIKRVDLDGGRPVPVAKATATCGASWGADQIVYCASWGAPLLAVPASGGASREVTSVQKGVDHFLPRFLPDGRRFVYATAGADDETARLFLGSIDGDEPVELVTADSTAQYAAGRLYYLRGQTLLARPFDAGRGRFTAEEAEIVAEGVESSRGSEFSVVPGLLAFAPHAADSGTRVSIYDRRGARLGSVDSETFVDDLTLSPDGRSAAVMRSSPGDGQELDVWTLDVARRVFSRVTYGESDDDPVFSPDGRTLAFAHRGDLYRRVLQGAGEPERLLEKKGDIVTQDWTADGWILYSDLDGENEDLYAVRAEGGEPRRLTSTTFREFLGQVSPDGRWLAYASNEGGDAQVYLTTWPELAGKWRVSEATAAMPRWSRGGRELYFLTQSSHLQRVSVAGTAERPEVGAVETLFPVDFQGNFASRTARWDVDAEGERFYVLENPQDQGEPGPAVMLLSNPAGGRAAAR